jgi:hypothetical protein
MRSLKVISISIIILIAAYSTGWYFLADARQKGIEAWAEELKNSQGTTITWQKIEKAGFPLRTAFIIKDPKVRYKQFAIDSDSSIEIPFSLTGSLQEVSAQINNALFLKNGLVQGTLKANMELESSLEGKTTFSLHNTNLSLSLEGTPLIENVSLDEASLVLNRSKSSNTYRFRADVEGIKYGFPKLVPKEGLSGYEWYLNEGLANKLSVASGAIDFELTLPPKLTLDRIAELPWLFLGASVPPCTLKLHEFKVTSNLVSELISGFLSVGEKDNIISVSGSIDASTTFSPAYYEALKDITRTYITEVHPQGKLDFNLLLPLIPKFHDFGPIVFKKEGKLEINKGTWTMSVSVPTVELATALYSIDLSFAASNMGGKGEATLMLHIHNFRRLIDDIISYFNHFTKVFNLVRQKSMYRLEPADDTTKTAIFAFFDLFTKDPKSADVTIDFRYKDGRVSFGKYTQEEFSEMAATVLQQILEQVMPEAVSSEALQKP